MIDVSGIEYNFLPSVLWTVPFIPVGVLLILWANKNTYEEWAPAPGVIGVISLLWGALLGPVTLMGALPGQVIASETYRVTTEQLSDQGFSRVDLDWEGKSFTASLDGQYFEGVLHPVGDYRYQVLAVEEVKP